MKNYILAISLLSFTSSLSFAQNRVIRPYWVDSPIPRSKEDILFKGVGTDRDNAIDNAVDMISRSFCNVKSSSRTEVSKESINGVSVPKKYAWKATNLDCGSVDYFNFQIVDEFEENGRYFVLTKVFAPSLKKAFALSFIPSAGQFYKSNNVLGGVVIASVGAFGVSSAWAFNSSNDIGRQIAYARTTPEITQLENDRDNRRTLGFTLLAAGTATYIFSIIHAGTHKNPKRLYASAMDRIHLSPFVFDRSAGIRISYNLK